ncbi:MAG: M20/M25/M40 family metallo-hydrolase [Gammaproteobacteria bacterium]|nr:M20/M25/M40 family metallo-hydrolase [Gammaproteobacteria bacterium]MDH5619874.1 M20/M25/M40 family metallo-hydrolase [Gammaproteobacteria bacterium]
MFRLATTIVCLFVSAAAVAQTGSASYGKDYQREARGIFDDIIGMRTAAGHGNVPAMAEYLAGLFRDAGFDDEDIHVIPQILSTGEQAASLVVQYRGNGLSGRKPVLLLAHMDVVDAIRSDWERDPFTLIEEDGFFFGRGTLDNKMGITTLTTTFLRLKRAGFTPTRDLVLAFSGDEETGMETTRALVTTHRNLTDAEFVLNADAGGGYQDHDHNPVAYLLQAAEKTYATYELTVRNPGGHSSTPRADNAIYELASALKNIEAHRFPGRINDITRDYFRKLSSLVPEPVSGAMSTFAEDQEDETARAVLEQMPGQVGVTRTTCVATMLRAGHAENALPQSATATVNCRIFPGVTAEEIKATLFEIAGNPNLEIVTLGEPLESPVSPMREEVSALVTDAAHAHYGVVPIIPYMAPYGTDGKETRLAGMDTYGVSGLFIREEDSFAHGLNERVPVKSFYTALEYWHQILTELGSER